MCTLWLQLAGHINSRLAGSFEYTVDADSHTLAYKIIRRLQDLEHFKIGSVSAE